MPDETGWFEIESGQAAATTIAPDPAEFAKKAKDLQALRDAVADAASVGGSLWLSYLFIFFYLAIAAGGITNSDLFFESPVKLPFLNVDLPLLGFFVLGPLLFLIVHAYTLLHFTFLADKVDAFHNELQRQIERSDPDTGELLRRQLPSNILVQFLAGPRRTHAGMMGSLFRRLLWVIVWISVVVAPVLLLVFFQFQFLPFHNVWISWWQRVVVVADLALRWILWSLMARGTTASFAWRDFLRGKVWVSLLLSVLPVLMVFTVATFPGEWLDEALPSIPFVPTTWSPHTLLVGGEVNRVTRRPRSLWSNRLVLPGIDVIDHTKYDTEAKIAALSETVSLRGRHLEGVALIGAHLRKTDFTGAYLQGAVLYAADLRGAKFECDPDGRVQQCADLQGARLDNAHLQDAMLKGAWLQGASLYKAQLQGASLDQAELQGALLDYAQLQGASLYNAQLQGASLDNAQLQGASLDAAELQGAVLFDAQLQGASLYYAQLQGASLDSTQLQGAALDDAQLQGTSLSNGFATIKEGDVNVVVPNPAKLQNASLNHVFVWRSDREIVRTDGTLVTSTDPETAGARITNLETAPKYQDLDCFLLGGSKTCSWTVETFAKLKQFIETAVPPGFGGSMRKDALARIESLDPDRNFQWQPDAWKRLEQSSLPPKDYDKALAATLRQIGCTTSGAPYVIHGLLRSGFYNRFTSDRTQAAAVAQTFLDEAHCPGAQGLSEQDKATLQIIRDRYDALRRE